MRVVAVIPARYAAQRLPGKPLSEIHGKPMIQWVYEQARKARRVHQVIVATDDQRIRQALLNLGAPGADVRMTDPALASGTDRVAAVADLVPADVYVNVQGDEPLIEPETIDAAVELVSSGRFPMGTAMTALESEQELRNPAVVKVVADRLGRAMYFSRHPIPYSRGELPARGQPWVCHRHLGLYVYARETLMRFRDLPPSPLEKAEVLEQLRALSDGIPIGITEVKSRSFGIDTPEDLERVRNILSR